MSSCATTPPATEKSSEKKTEFPPSILDLDARETFRSQHKLQPYRHRQILHAIFQESIIDFAEMTTLPLELRELLAENFSIVPLELDRQVDDPETTKFLFKTDKNAFLETVLMHHSAHSDQKSEEKINRFTLCISSQVGCPVGCIFCVTGKLGFLKNCARTEILGQILFANNFLRKNFGKKSDGTLRKVRNIVFMGMGEPLLNYPAVKETIPFLTDTKFLGLSRRRVTVSTSGVTPKILQFADDNLPVSLAFSLHAPNQKLREELIPNFAKMYDLESLMSAIKTYEQKTGNEVMYEYVMIKNCNDSPEIAHQLGQLLRDRHAHLNLIPYNENPAIDLEESDPATIKKFADIVKSYGIPTTVRQNMGRSKKSACGQLGYESLQEQLKKNEKIPA